MSGKQLEKFSNVAARFLERARQVGLGYQHAIAITFVFVLIAAAIGAPVIAPYAPEQQFLDAILQKPSAAHLLGTDDVGRDILSRLIYGARTSLLGALVAGGVAIAVGLPVGLISGAIGGRTDAILMRVVDAMLAFPAIILALAIVGILGPGLLNAMLAIGLVYSPRLARLLRGQVLSLQGRGFVEAAKLSGMNPVAIMVRHLLPNSMRPVIVQWFLMLAFAFLAEAALSFLGLGVQPPDASWGHMLSRAYRTMSIAGWQIWAPGLVIAISVLALNTVGDAVSRWLSRGTLD